MCCIPQCIRSGADVETAARVLHPRPFVFSPRAYDGVERRAIMETLERLAQLRRIRMLPADVEGDWAIFWNGHAMHLEPNALLVGFADKSKGNRRDAATLPVALPPFCMVEAEEAAQWRTMQAEAEVRARAWVAQAPRPPLVGAKRTRASLPK